VKTQKQRWQVPAYRWTNTEQFEQRVAQYGDREHYTGRFAAKERTQELEDAFEIEIDLQALIDMMVRRARSTKSGKSVLLDGLAVAKRTSRKVLSEIVADRELPTGWSWKDARVAIAKAESGA
jgi:hypothetical protein